MRRAFYRTIFTLSLCAFSLLEAYPYNVPVFQWEPFADAVFLRRGKGAYHILVNDVAIGDTVLEVDNVTHTFNYELGYRLGVRFQSNRKLTFEAFYFGPFLWEGEKSVTDTGNLYFAFNTPFANDFMQADRARAKYHSKLEGAEMNFWVHMTPRRLNYFSFSWCLGARGLLLNEEFKVNFRKGGNRSDYKTSTRNQMIGLQGGATLEWNPVRRLTWGATVKFAAFGNQAKQKSFLFDNNNTVTLRHFDQAGLHPAYLGDFLAFVQYHMGSRFHLEGALQYIYIDNAALAPKQIGYGTGSKSGDRLSFQSETNYYGFWVGASLEF